jgi:hypothetical protein
LLLLLLKLNVADAQQHTQSPLLLQQQPRLLRRHHSNRRRRGSSRSGHIIIVVCTITVVEMLTKSQTVARLFVKSTLGNQSPLPFMDTQFFYLI